MNNQTTTDEDQESICSTLKKAHLIISVISLVAVAIGLFIGFVTSVHWSILVTGTSDQTGYIFERLAIPMGIIVLTLLVVYTILPFFLGYLATTVQPYEKLKTTSSKFHLTTAAIVLVDFFLVSYVFFNNPPIFFILILIIFLIWGMECFTKHILMLSIFVIINIFGDLFGWIILLEMTRAASITIPKDEMKSVYVSLLALSFVFTTSGVIFATKENEIGQIFSVVAGLIFVAGFTMVMVDIPQNTLISLNHGTLLTPEPLKTAIVMTSTTRRSKKNERNQVKCNYINIITHGNYKLFSCGEKKDSLKGEIFYEKMPADDINKISNDSKIISKYYCFSSSDNGKYIHCIRKYILTDKKLSSDKPK